MHQVAFTPIINDEYDLEVIEDIKAEIIHFWDPADSSYIYSIGNHFWGLSRGEKFDFFINVKPPNNIALSIRLLRRALRYDKSNAVFNFKKDGIIIVYRGKVYFFCLLKKKYKFVLSLKNCRNVLHNGICVTKKAIFFGEYGANTERKNVPIYGSYDDGRNWNEVYSFPNNYIKHIHGIYFDKFSNSLFIATGDFEKECFIAKVPNGDFSSLEIIGDGSQNYRCVSIFFKEDKIIWGMDSPLEKSYLQILDRKTNKLTRGISFPGPVWYSKNFQDGSGIIQTSVEIGPSVQDNYSYIYFSRDLLEWKKLAKFKKDFYPMNLFKFGVLGFSEGNQLPTKFPIHCEALKNVDGKSLILSITKKHSESK